MLSLSRPTLIATIGAMTARRRLATGDVGS